MSEFPKLFFYPQPLVHVMSHGNNGLGAFTGAGGGNASNAYPTANNAVFIPVRIGAPYTFNTVFWVNGATASGNVDAGIYDISGNRIVTTGSTPQSGTAAVQSVSVATTEIGPGAYYLAIVMNNTTGTLRSITAATRTFFRTEGIANVANAFPLPSTVTYSKFVDAFVPIIGITGRGFV